MPDSERMPRTAMRTVVGAAAWVLAVGGAVGGPAVGAAAGALVAGGRVAASRAGGADAPAQAALRAATSSPSAGLRQRLIPVALARRAPRPALSIALSSSPTATADETWYRDRSRGWQA